MANKKRAPKRPRPKHTNRRQKSQYDNARRLRQPNPKRVKTAGPRVPLHGMFAASVAVLAAVLNAKCGWRLEVIFSGMLLSDDRRTVAAWLAAGGVKEDWDRFYDLVRRIGLDSGVIASVVLGQIARRFLKSEGEPIVLAVDDSPTKRYGSHVEGAGVHHNPTPGPADGDWLYGHNWVSLAWLQDHPLGGVMALPIRSSLYVRQCDVAELDPRYQWRFQTKLEIARDLLLWCIAGLRSRGVRSPIRVTMDGAYAARELLRTLKDQDVTVVSRLRSNARLNDLPGPQEPGKRGRPPIYGKNRISLRKRAAHREGWSTIRYWCRGSEVTRQYKTFLATSRLVGGEIRVVIVRMDGDGWAAYFSTNPQLEPREILETAAARWAIEEQFHDVKEVCGAGQQQVRNIWSSIGCWNLNQWLYTLVELATWEESQESLTDRSDRLWDNPSRRPSHADRRKRITREMLHQQFMSVLPDGPDQEKISRAFGELLYLAT